MLFTYKYYESSDSYLNVNEDLTEEPKTLRLLPTWTFHALNQELYFDAATPSLTDLPP